MKYCIAFIFLILFPLLSFSQINQQDYDNFNIKYSSIGTLNRLSEDLCGDKETGWKISPQAVELSTNEEQKYIEDFSNAVKATREQNDLVEKNRKFMFDLLEVGVSTAGGMISDITPYGLGNFVSPVLEKTTELYVESNLEELKKDNQGKIAKVIENQISILHSKGLKPEEVTSSEGLQNLLVLAGQDKVGFDELPVLNKELVEYGYKYINENRNAIKNLAYRTDIELKDLEKELSKDIEKLENALLKKVNEDFEKISISFKKLSDNQEVVFGELNSIRNHVKENEKRISSLEKTMADTRNSVNVIAKAQLQHDKLIQENKFRIGILSGYAYQNLNTKERIQALDKGHFDNIFDSKEKTELRGQLEKIDEKETIISVANDVVKYSQYANSAYQMLTEANILKGEDAKRVGKFLSFATAAVQVGTGAARMWAGDVSGVMSIISGLGGLGGGNNQPSQEMQMLNKIYEAMQENFEVVNQKLDVINEKIDNLTSITIDMYSTLVKSHYMTMNKLGELGNKIDDLRYISRDYFFKEYKRCERIADADSKVGIKITSYSDFDKYYKNDFDKRPCLKALLDFLDSPNNFNLAISAEAADQKVIEHLVKTYTNTSELYNSFFSHGINKQKGLLFLPVHTQESKKIFDKANRNTDLLEVEYINSSLLNPHMIIEFINYYLSYVEYYEVLNSDYEPMSIKEYISLSEEVKSIRILKQKRRYEDIINMINRSIAQEALKAGHTLLQPMRYAVSTNRDKSINVKVKQALSMNKTLANNFITFFLFKELQNYNLENEYNSSHKDGFEQYELYWYAFTDKTLNDKNSIGQLNKLIGIDGITFISQDNKVKLKFDKRIFDKELLLDVPRPEHVYQNEMLYSPVTYDLIDLRSQLNKKLFELTFTSNIEDGRIDDFKNVYFRASKLRQEKNN